MARPTIAEINLAAVAHNYRALLGLCAEGVGCIGVVKADAYGHGAVRVAQTLVTEGVAVLAVALTEEAAELQDAGVSGRILVMGFPTADDADEIVARGLEPAVSGVGQAEELDNVARTAGRRVGVHLKFDTGMGRIGVALNRAVETTQRISSLSNLRIVGAMTHFPSADEPAARDVTLGQIAAFRALRADLAQAGIKIPLWHAANSAASLYYPEAHLDAIRPGLALYGSYPSAKMQTAADLRQPLTFKTRIACIRELPRNATVSYGRTHRLEKPSRIAVLPVGYADGYDRRFSNRGQVLVRGRRAPVVGRVCMDLTMIDVTEIAGASAGDQVVLYGAQGDDRITIDEVTPLLGSVQQEVMTSIGKRVPRVYRS